jgi:hypothetical protein
MPVCCATFFLVNPLIFSLVGVVFLGDFFFFPLLGFV